MKRSMIVMLLVVGLFFGTLFGWKAFVGMQIAESMQAAAMPPITVSTAVASSETWAPVIYAVGSLRAMQGVDVTPQVAGQITELHFESGDEVAAGDLLIQQYTADEVAQLRGLVAERELAELNFARLQNLAKQKLVSEFDLDSGRTDVQRTKAAETTLRLNIEKKAVRAPFAGRLGIRRIDLGQYVEPGDTIVRLEAVDQLLVDFSVSQRRIGELSIGQPIAVLVDAWPDARFAGVIDAIDPQVQFDTRNLRVRGVLENRDTKLLPGMFAGVEIELPARAAIVTVPQAAIAYSPYGDAVYVVQEERDADGKPMYTVVNTFVVPGPTRGDQVAIESGLAAGATVVTAGQQKLRNGAQVLIDNSVVVSNSSAPQPGNN